MESEIIVKKEVEEEDEEVQVTAYHIPSTLSKCNCEKDSNPDCPFFREPIYTPSKELKGPLWMVNFQVDFWEYPDREALRAERKEHLLLYFPEKCSTDAIKDFYKLETVKSVSVSKMKRKVYVEETDSDSSVEGRLCINEKSNSDEKSFDIDSGGILKGKDEILATSHKSKNVGTESNTMKEKIHEWRKKKKKHHLNGVKNLFLICKKKAEREYEKTKVANEQLKAKKDEDLINNKPDGQKSTNLLEKENDKIVKPINSKKSKGSESESYVPKKIERHDKRRDSHKKSNKKGIHDHSSSNSRKRDSTDSGYDHRIKSRKRCVSPRSIAKIPNKSVNVQKKPVELWNTSAKISKKSSDIDSGKSQRQKSESSVRKEKSKIVANDFSSLDPIDQIMSDLINDPVAEERVNPCGPAKNLSKDRDLETNNADIVSEPVLQVRNEDNVSVKKEIIVKEEDEVIAITNKKVLDSDIIIIDSPPMKRSNEGVIKTANKRIKTTLSKSQENIQNIVSSFNDILNFQNMVYELDRAKSKHHVFANNMFNEWITRNGNNLINNFKSFKLLCNADSDPLEELEKISKIPKNELSFMLKICEKNNSDCEFHEPPRNIYLLPPPIVYLLEHIPKLSPDLRDVVIKQYELSKAFLSPALPCIRKLDTHFSNSKSLLPTVGVVNCSNSCQELSLHSPRNGSLLPTSTSPRSQLQSNYLQETTITPVNRETNASSFHCPSNRLPLSNSPSSQVESQYNQETAISLPNAANKEINRTPPFFHPSSIPILPISSSPRSQYTQDVNVRTLNPTATLSPRTRVSQTQNNSSAEKSTDNITTRLPMSPVNCAEDSTLPILNSDAMAYLSQINDSTFNGSEQTAIHQRSQNEARRIEAELTASTVIVPKTVNSSQRSSSNPANVIMNRPTQNINPTYQDPKNSGFQNKNSANRTNHSNKKTNSGNVPFYSIPRRSPTVAQPGGNAIIPNNLSLPTISVSPDNAQIAGNATLPQSYQKSFHRSRIQTNSNTQNNGYAAGNAEFQQNNFSYTPSSTILDEIIPETYSQLSQNGNSFSSAAIQYTPITKNNAQIPNRTALPYNNIAPTRANASVEQNVVRLSSSTLSDRVRCQTSSLYSVPISNTESVQMNSTTSCESTGINHLSQGNNDYSSHNNYHARRISSSRYEILPMPSSSQPKSHENEQNGVGSTQNKTLPSISHKRSLGNPRIATKQGSNNLSLPSYNELNEEPLNITTNNEMRRIGNDHYRATRGDVPRLMVRRDITDQTRLNYQPQLQNILNNNSHGNAWHIQQRHN